MRRLLFAALAAFALVAPVRAEIAVVYDTYWENEAASSYGDPHMQSRMLAAAVDILETTGAHYTLWPIQQTKTSLIADGIVTVGSKTYQYDGVLWLGFNGRSTSSAVPLPNKPSFTGCYPCSLTLTGNANATVPSVPHLLTFGAVLGSVNRSWTYYSQNAAGLRCSTGVTASGGVSAHGQAWEGQAGYETEGWLPASNRGGGGGHGNYVPAAAPPGGFRPLLRSHFAATRIEAEAIGGAAHACARCDSAMTPFDEDTLQAWEIPGGTVASGNASPLIFGNIMGAGPCVDSLENAVGDAQNVACEFDAPAFLFLLARLDSASGGGVWDTDSKLPLTASLVIKGGFRRGLRKAYGGANTADTATVKASIDSLATRNIPVTLETNVDSLDAYPAEQAWWSRLGSRIRYSPVAYRGIADTTTTSDTTGTLRPVDAFGRFRTRKYYGPAYTSGADTSIYAQIVYKRNRLAAVVGGDRLSRLLMAPLDDYSPRNLLWAAAGNDSLIFAAEQAGYDRILTDVRTRSANPASLGNVNRDLLIGFEPKQRRVRSAINGRDFFFLGQTGFSISGGHYSCDTTNGAQFSFGSSLTYPTIPHGILGRWWGGLVHDTWDDYDWFPYDGASTSQVGHTRSYEDMFARFHRANVLVLHVSDLSGLPGGPPARPGWWAVKSLDNQMRAINRAAGRTIMRWGWPEELTP